MKTVYSSSVHYSIGKLRLALYLLGLIFFNSIVLHAQQVTPSKTVYIGNFQPHESDRNSNIEKEIQSTLNKKIQGSGLNPVDSTKSTTSERLTEAKQANARFLLEGFYNKKNSDSNLNLYIQVYDPESGQMIDAYSITDEIYQSEGLQLDKEELKESDQSIVEKLANKTSLILRSNPNKKKNPSNLEQYASSSRLSEKLKPYLQTNEKAAEQAATEVFDLLQGQVTVSATKIAKKTNEAPNIVSVISDKEIRDYGRVSINDILFQLPGFAPSQVNDRRTVSSRGMYEGWNNNHLLMLVDGVQHNDLFYGTALTWEITPLNMIKSLEVIRGPGSALYGSNATNGVISLNTFSGSDLNGALKLRARMGDYGTRIYDLITGNKGKMFSHVVSYNSYETDGNNYTNYDGSGRKDAFGFLQKFQHRDERNSYYLFTKLEGEGDLKGLSFQYHRQKWNYQAFDGWLQNVPDIKDRQTEYRDVFTAKYSKNISDKLSQEYVMRYNNGYWDYNYRALPNSPDYPSGVTENLKSKIENLFLRAQLTYLLSNGGTFVAGVEGNRLSYNGDISHNSNINMNILGDQNTNPSGAFLPLNPSMEWIQNRPILKIAPFAQLTSGKLFNNKVEFTAGIRYDETSIKFRGIDEPYKNWIGIPGITVTDPNTQESTTYNIPSQYLSAPFVPNEHKTYRRTSPRGGIVYFFSDRLTFKAMIGRAFREPSAGELFGVNTYVGGSNNPRKISPEVIKTSEIAMDWTINSNFNLRINGFNTRFENAIDYSGTSNSIVNAYTLGTRGIETELLTSFKYFSTFVNYSRFYRFLDNNLDATISKHPNEIKNSPGYTANAGISSTWEKWIGSISLQRQGAVYRRTNDQGPIDPLTGYNTSNTNSNPYSFPQYRPKNVPAWISVNFRVSYKFAESMQLGLYVTNLFNSHQTLARRADYPFDYIREGRRVMVDFQASF
ncbi:MAG: TonB-dependent receptor [Leptospiraceae bacterium]|nr:TonB-dependent receptor [Leptospiraceae bacterium]MBK7058394.1 TonB-dependent receptor [Leptospiraceae bacterium]MBL0263671.1 TonB-dependent receptor [Leptospiraceae bacterium]MBP9162478.1 TonB-dependent receptor [Leptospiraceae bacterium]